MPDKVQTSATKKSPDELSETGFLNPADPLHKAMAELPWPVLRDAFLIPVGSETSKESPTDSNKPPRQD
jgi:hypothetical protein